MEPTDQKTTKSHMGDAEVMEKKVCVLMSTYNGEKYLSEQLDSILVQQSVEVYINIRDDGSTDGTQKILDKYKEEYGNITVQYGENIGYERSFYYLMVYAQEYEYYAFADQDDVWDTDKLCVAIEKLEEKCSNTPKIVPAVYWCNLRNVDSKLAFQSIMKPATESVFDKYRYLIDKYGYGCTMVFTRKLLEIAVEHKPSKNISHDNWIGILGVYFGKKVFDEKAHISYRQHGNNLIGGNNGFICTWKRRLKNLSKVKQYSRAIIAKELLSGYGDRLTEEEKSALHIVADYNKSLHNKLRFLQDKRFRRASKEKDFLFKICIILSLA